MDVRASSLTLIFIFQATRRQTLKSTVFI